MMLLIKTLILIVITFSIVRGQELKVNEVNIENITKAQFEYIYSIGYNDSISYNYSPLLERFNTLATNSLLLQSELENLTNNFNKQLELAKLEYQLKLDSQFLQSKYKYDKRSFISVGVTVGVMSLLMIGSHLVDINPYQINLN